MTWTEGQKVWVEHCNSGYQGPGEVLGPVPVNKWLVKTLDGNERVVVVNVNDLKEIATNDLPASLSKKERREERKKLKAERKNHRAPESAGQQRRR